MRPFREVWQSTIFTKWVMAITGLLIVGFLLGHLSGNMLMFLGQEHMNEYGVELRSLLHGAGIWVVRLGLVAIFCLHILSALKLSGRNRKARPTRYAKVTPQESTLAGRTMLLSGLLLLAYILYHLAHFTWGIVHADFYAHNVGYEYTLANGHVVPDVYKMVVNSFQQPLIAVLYLVAMVFTGLHMNHAIGSALQTLGLTNHRLVPVLRKAGVGLSIIIAAGFSAVPISILIGIVK
ncbi:hypothetical protein BH10BAC6_BH10BAC6_08970 [soil metagenome]